nr:Sm_multidrug_ex domain-containing protein [Ipomoea batatas]
MTTSLSHSPAFLNAIHGSSKPKLPFPKISFFPVNKGQFHLNSKYFATFHEFANPKNSKFPKLIVPRASTDDLIEAIEKEGFLGDEEKPAKSLLWALFWASVSICLFAVSGEAKAAADSIKASGFGVKVATALRGLGWKDEIVVFALATLPVLELRGAIPVGYWLQLKPLPLTVLSVLGNMVPVPFIVLYLKRFANFLVQNNRSASRFLEMFLDWTKKKAGPVEEFRWLGLMLFVAVPFPGTGAWTGAIIASVLEMPFWSAVSANFVGVVLAGLLVNLLVNLGLKYAVITGVILFVVSTFMWGALRGIKRSLNLSP